MYLRDEVGGVHTRLPGYGLKPLWVRRKNEAAGWTQVIDEPLKMDTARHWPELERPLDVDKRRVCCGHLQSLMTPRGGHRGSLMNPSK